MEYSQEQFDDLCTAIKEYYTPTRDSETEDNFYDYDDDDDDPTFTFRVRGVLVDFGSVLNYNGVHQLREGGVYSDGRTFSGRTIERLAHNILTGNFDDI